MEHRGAHSEAINPYNLPQNSKLNTYCSPDMLPVTNDIIERTYNFALHCDWTDEEVNAKIEAILTRASIL